MNSLLSPTALAIADLSDAGLLHTDAACDGLHALVDHAERALGEPVADPQALVEAAAALGLLVEPGVPAGERWCRSCSHSRTARSRPARPAVHALAA